MLCHYFIALQLVFFEKGGFTLNNEYKGDYELILSSLEKIIDKKIEEYLTKYGIEASSYAKVVSVSGTKATVKMLNEESNTLTLENKSGSTLSAGDNVKIYGSAKNLSNRYIGLKV